MTSRKRPPIPVIVLVALIVLGGAGGWWWVSTHPASASEAASGAVEARQYQVASVLAGRVSAVKVAEGDTVKADQVLVTLDDAALKLQVEQATQGVNAAKATLQQAKDDDKGSAEIAADEARVKQAQASVDLAQVQQSYAAIKAPHGGTVVALTTNAGQNAAPGKTLLTITDPADLFVRVYVPETRIGHVAVGQAVKIATDAGSATYDGHVTFIASDAEFTPTNIDTKDQRSKLVYEVRVSVTDASGVLKAGLPADVTFA